MRAAEVTRSARCRRARARSASSTPSACVRATQRAASECAQLTRRRAQHAIALLFDDAPRTRALLRLIRAQQTFVHQLRTLSCVAQRAGGPHRRPRSPAHTARSEWYAPALTHALLHTAADAGAAAADDDDVVRRRRSVLPVADARAVTGAALAAQSAARGAADGGDSEQTLQALPAAAQLGVLLSGVDELQAAAERFLNALLGAFIVSDEDAHGPPSIHRSASADVGANVEMGNVALAAQLFVDALADYLAAPFETFARNAYRAELVLRVLMRTEAFAAKQAQVRAALSGDGVAAVSLGDLLLAPLRILPQYATVLQGMLDATPESDWRERRRLRAALELVTPRLDELSAVASETASQNELLLLERRLTNLPFKKLASPGRRVILQAERLLVAHKSPPKWSERFVVLCNDLILWAKVRCAARVPRRSVSLGAQAASTRSHDGFAKRMSLGFASSSGAAAPAATDDSAAQSLPPLQYDQHIDLADALIYRATDSNGLPVVLQNNVLIQLVNKRNRKLRIYSLKFASTHARRRWFVAITQRINSYMNEVAETYHKEQAQKLEDERNAMLEEQEARDRARLAALREQETAAERELASLRRAALSFHQSSKRALDGYSQQLDCAEKALGDLEVDLDALDRDAAEFDAELEEIERKR